MKIEKWMYKGKEVEVPVFEEDEIETNENIKDLEKTKELTSELEEISEENE